MDDGRVARGGSPPIDGLGAWEGVRPVLWVRVGTAVGAVAYLGHLLVCWALWPVPIGDPIGEALTFAACVVGFLVAPRRPGLGAALALGAVAAEVLAASVVVPSAWVASLPVLPVAILGTGLFFGARAALQASVAAIVAYPIVHLVAGRIGPAAGGLPPVELSRLVVFTGACAGSGVLTWLALRTLARLHAEAVERRQLEHRIQEAHRLQLVGELAGAAAHDFRNVLGVFQNAAGLLAASADPELRALGEELSRTARSGHGIARRILSLARRTEGRREVIDVAQTVEEIRPLVVRLLGPRCGLAVAAEGPAAAVADPGELEQVLLNLAANARDAMEGAGTVSVKVRDIAKPEADRLGSTLASPRQVLLEVADHGRGIPPELHARIFEPFVTSKPRGEGTGLGLSTVRSIAHASGGAVSFESRPGEGAAFRVFLPAAVSGAATASARSAS